MIHQHTETTMTESDNTIIRLSDVTMTWSRRKILDNITLTVNKGDFLAVTGPNGGGKTTLLRIILKLLTPTSGSVGYFSGGKPVERLSIGYLPQKNMIDSRFPITVREVVRLGLYNQKHLTTKECDEMTAQAIETVGLSPHTDAGIGNLSGGQLQRALLARAIISKPQVLVLDEPLSYVDKQFEQRIYDIISQLAPSTTIILVSHEMSTIASMANRHIIVNRTLHFCHSASHFMHYDCCTD